MVYELHPIKQPIIGKIAAPGDKSISHRSVILASIAHGTSRIYNFLNSEDCMRTIEAFQTLGVKIIKKDSFIEIEGKGLSNLKEPRTPIYFGNSGTTARLMIGLLAGLPFFTSVYGDISLSKRPMNRVVQPLLEMGALMDGRNNADYLPIAIKGQQLMGFTYKLPVKSAQVKSSLLLAGLLANGKTTIVEDIPTRNHTENMLIALGADLTVNHREITVTNKNKLKAMEIHVPGDISSAAFLLVAAAIIPNSKLTITNVSLNNTRTGILTVLKQMGAYVTIQNEQINTGEMYGNVTVGYSRLKSTVIEGDIIPTLIDEIPIIALLATQAEGTTIIRNAEELKIKETDRITAVVAVLSKLGANITATKDGMIIKGKTSLKGAPVSSFNDHRIAMLIAIASLIAEGETLIDEISSINISYPNFFEDLHTLIDS